MLRLFVLSLFALLASCSVTRHVAINTMDPAEVNLSDRIVRIGVLNRVDSNKKADLGNGIERLVAIEDQWLVAKGQDAALNSLVEELQKDNRFEVESLDIAANEFFRTEINTIDIPWDEIKKICEKHNIDALFSLTHFDAETNVSLKNTKMEQLNMMREKEKVSGQEITLETLINNSWRIYDPVLEQIIDEYSYNQHFVSRAKGVDPVAALKAIGSRKDSVLNSGVLSGNSYGERLKPNERQIFREYFVKGTDKLVQAGESMASGDLTTATQLWKEEVSNSKVKIKGRACYNLAVGMEFSGDLEQALDWASKANESLNDKNSQRYLIDLEYRLKQQAVVKTQLAQLHFDD